MSLYIDLCKRKVTIIILYIIMHNVEKAEVRVSVINMK